MNTKQTVGILDLGLGNLRNVIKASQHFGLKTTLIKKELDIKNIDKLILPGVGSFSHFSKNINNENLKEGILKYIEKKKYLLGICLGMQVLKYKSYENGEHKGLEIIKGDVASLKTLDNSIITPNFGWYKIKKKTNKNNFFDKFVNKKFYFAHSYFCNSYNETLDIFMNINGNEISAGFQYENILGTQFHPELSGKNGLDFYRSFFEL